MVGIKKTSVNKQEAESTIKPKTPRKIQLTKNAAVEKRGPRDR